MRSYEYRHIVTFEDTNAVGNVYYVNHLRWQGRCRELFLREHAPEVFAALAGGLCLVTTRCSCEYMMELAANDEVVVRMTLLDQTQNRMTMGFAYYRVSNGAEVLVARGEQQVATLRRDGDGVVPAPIPAALLAALEPFRAI
jgi:enediyne biosynthesis thioesterase